MFLRIFRSVVCDFVTNMSDVTPTKPRARVWEPPGATPASLRKTIGKRLREGALDTAAYMVAQGVGGVVGALSDNPVLGVVASSGTYALEQHFLNEGSVPQEYSQEHSFLRSFEKSHFMKYTKPMLKKKNYVKKTFNSKRYGKMVLTRGPTYAPERKHADQSFSVNFSTDGSFVVFSCGPFPTQGTDFTNRIGRKIQVVGYEMNMQVSIGSLNYIPLGGTEVICDLWQDKETKGALCANTDIYNGTYAPSLTNATNIKRFKKLHRMRHPIRVVTVSSGSVQAIDLLDMGETGYKSHKMAVNFTANNGTIADIMDNGFVGAVSMVSAPVVGSPGSIGVNFRVWYIDL
nr:MAG: capsid protein [Cressdnaviricota sp.]